MIALVCAALAATAPLVSWHAAASTPGWDTRTVSLLDGILIGTVVGRWVAQAWLHWTHPTAPWARGLGVAALGVGLVVEGSAGAVTPIHAAAVVILALLLSWPPVPPSPPPRPRGAVAWATVGMVAGIGTGLVIAWGGSTIAFDPWFASLQVAHYPTGLPDSIRADARPWLGAVGGHTAAQFVILAGWVLYRGADHGRRIAGVGFASVGLWFCIDSGLSLRAEAGFNVVLVNLPALIPTVGPLVWLYTRSRPSG